MKQLDKAIQFATKAHEGQTRKYTGEPYIVHPLAVMEIVKTVEHTEEMLMAAVLHDTVEDCDVTLDQIAFNFGHVVADLVEELTDVSKPEDGNRATRKEIDKNFLAEQSAEVQTIKYADVISNSKDIRVYDPKFAEVYFTEIKALLEVMDKGDPALYQKAKEIVYSS